MGNSEYEFYDEWINRDSEEEHISLHDYNESCCIESYGYDMSDCEE